MHRVPCKDKLQGSGKCSFCSFFHSPYRELLPPTEKRIKHDIIQYKNANGSGNTYQRNDCGKSLCCLGSLWSGATWQRIWTELPALSPWQGKKGDLGEVSKLDENGNTHLGTGYWWKALKRFANFYVAKLPGQENNSKEWLKFYCVKCSGSC